MNDIPNQKLRSPIFSDPVDLVRKAFETAFPYLIVTEVALRKEVEETRGVDGWKTFRETGGFCCTVQAQRRTDI